MGGNEAVLGSRSQSWSRKEPELLAGAEAGAGILKFRLQLQVKLKYCSVLNHNSY